MEKVTRLQTIWAKLLSLQMSYGKILLLLEVSFSDVCIYLHMYREMRWVPQDACTFNARYEFTALKPLTCHVLVSSSLCLFFLCFLCSPGSNQLIITPCVLWSLSFPLSFVTVTLFCLVNHQKSKHKTGNKILLYYT